VIRLVIRNTSFAVTIRPNIPDEANLIRRFNNNLITYSTNYVPRLRKVIKTEDRRYYYKVNNTFYYSIHLLNTFIKRALKIGFKKESFKILRDVTYYPNELDVSMQDGYEDRAHQPMYIDKIIETNPMILVDLPTGKGKTYISMRVCTQLNVATGIVVLSRYIDKWVSDLQELTTVDRESIYVVKGKDSLLKLLESDEKYDFIIFSLSTLRNYIKKCDDEPSNRSIPPEDLFKELGLGIMLCDEVHQSFHAGYMIAIRLNPLKVIALSATLDNLDHSITMMYATLYPIEARCGSLAYFKPHPIVIAANYYIDNQRGLSCKGPRGYSHTLYEQTILRNSLFRDQYLKMVMYYINKGYINRRKAGDKLLVLVQTVRLATLLTNYIRAKTKKLKISRYVEEDPYENIIESDITVSTNLSASTALDIPKLITVLQTVSIGSLQANIQALGRLREIKGTDVKYYYLYSSSLSQQYKLHVTRRDIIKPLAKQYLYEEYPLRLNSG